MSYAVVRSLMGADINLKNDAAIMFGEIVAPNAAVQGAAIQHLTIQTQQQFQALGNQITQLSQNVTQLGQNVTQLGQNLQTGLLRIEQRMDQAETIRINVARSKVDAPLIPVPVQGAQYPAGMPVNMRVLATYGDVKKLNLDELHAWLRFYSVPLFGTKPQKQQKLWTTIGALGHWKD